MWAHDPWSAHDGSTSNKKCTPDDYNDYNDCNDCGRTFQPPVGDSDAKQPVSGLTDLKEVECQISASVSFCDFPLNVLLNQLHKLICGVLYNDYNDSIDYIDYIDYNDYTEHNYYNYYNNYNDSNNYNYNKDCKDYNDYNDDNDYNDYNDNNNYNDYSDYNDSNNYNDYNDSDLDLDSDWERCSELVTQLTITDKLRSIEG